MKQNGVAHRHVLRPEREPATLCKFCRPVLKVALVLSRKQAVTSKPRDTLLFMCRPRSIAAKIRLDFTLHGGQSRFGLPKSMADERKGVALFCVERCGAGCSLQALGIRVGCTGFVHVAVHPRDVPAVVPLTVMPSQNRLTHRDVVANSMRRPCRTLRFFRLLISALRKSLSTQGRALTPIFKSLFKWRSSSRQRVDQFLGWVRPKGDLATKLLTSQSAQNRSIGSCITLYNPDVARCFSWSCRLRLGRTNPQAMQTQHRLRIYDRTRCDGQLWCGRCHAMWRDSAALRACCWVPA